MKPSPKIFLAIFIIALISLGYWSFVIFRDRNSYDSKENTPAKTDDATQEDFVSDEAAEISAEEIQDEEIINENEDKEESEIIAEDNNFLDVFTEDCDNGCKNFQDTEDLKYCQQICGLVENKKESKEKEGCDALQDLEKDYCLKDLAVSKTDAKICEQIEDTGIKRTCHNRIIEDIIDSQTKQQ